MGSGATLDEPPFTSAEPEDEGEESGEDDDGDGDGDAEGGFGDAAAGRCGWAR